MRNIYWDLNEENASLKMWFMLFFFFQLTNEILASVLMTKSTGAVQRMKVKMSIFDQSQWRIWRQVLRKRCQAQISTLIPCGEEFCIRPATQFSVYLLQTNASSINLEPAVLTCKGFQINVGLRDSKMKLAVTTYVSMVPNLFLDSGVRYP